VDTSVWSLALRRDASREPEVDLLESSLARGDIVITTGLVLQELLQGFQGPRAKDKIIRSFSLLPVISPDLDDHIEAAGLRNTCRRKGVQIGTIDALIAQLCIRHSLQLLTTDDDFRHMAKHTSLSLLTSKTSR
jgi:predicted nucleic acid-binding protein